MDLVYRDEAYGVIDACFEVYNEMGVGFLEEVYQEASEREFSIRGIPFNSKPRLEIHYKGSLPLGRYQPDFVLHSKIILDIKSMRALADGHRAEVHNYLKASSFKLGILVNSGRPGELGYERIVRAKPSLKDSLDSQDSRCQ